MNIHRFIVFFVVFIQWNSICHCICCFRRFDFIDQFHFSTIFHVTIFQISIPPNLFIAWEETAGGVRWWCVSSTYVIIVVIFKHFTALIEQSSIPYFHIFTMFLSFPFGDLNFCAELFQSNVLETLTKLLFDTFLVRLVGNILLSNYIDDRTENFSKFSVCRLVTHEKNHSISSLLLDTHFVDCCRPINTYVSHNISR